MIGHFGFLYIGLVYLLLLFIPNVAWAKNKPRDYDSSGKKLAGADAIRQIDVSFGAVCTLDICSAGLMGIPIALSDYRWRKILKRYKVTPISPMTLLMSHVLFCFSLFIVSIHAIGMVVASLASNAQMAGVIASIVYFPMIFLSGATIPYEIMPRALQTVADFMPLTQGIKLLKTVSLGQPLTDALFSFVVMAVVAVIGVVISVRFFRWE